MDGWIDGWMDSQADPCTDLRFLTWGGVQPRWPEYRIRTWDQYVRTHTHTHTHTHACTDRHMNVHAQGDG